MSKSSETDQKKIKRYIIDHIDGEGYGETLTTDAEKIEFLRSTFDAEYGWQIARLGRQHALQEWLQGLPSAVNLPFYSGDILDLARETGGLAVDATERQEQKIIDNYWNYMSAKIFQLFNGYQVPKTEEDKNVKSE